MKGEQGTMSPPGPPGEAVYVPEDGVIGQSVPRGRSRRQVSGRGWWGGGGEVGEGESGIREEGLVGLLL